MARARNIKPGFYENEDLGACTMAARLLFPALWQMADREGRLEDRPLRIKGYAFRYDSTDVEPLLAELAKRGFIFRYMGDGKALIQILKFWKHQNPHHKEAKSILPSPQSLGLLPHERRVKTEAQPALEEDEAQGEPEARTDLGSQEADLHGGGTLLNPDSLNPDSLVSDPRLPTPDSLQETLPPAVQPAIDEEISTTPARLDGGEPGGEDKLPEGEPIAKPLTAKDLIAEGVEAQVAADWLRVRKVKKALLTETAWNAVKLEAAKAGISLNSAIKIAAAENWQGFKDSWLNDTKTGPRPRGDAKLPSAAGADRDAHKARAKQLAFSGTVRQGAIDV